MTESETRWRKAKRNNERGISEGKNDRDRKTKRARKRDTSATISWIAW